VKFLDALIPRSFNPGNWGIPAPGDSLDLLDGYGGWFGTDVPIQTTYKRLPAEPVEANFGGYVQAGLKGNGIIFALERKRLEVFTQASFLFQELIDGRPGNLVDGPGLDVLRTPYPAGITADMLGRLLWDADFAGNAFQARMSGEIVRLRPDWVQIVLKQRLGPFGFDGSDVQVGWQQVGIIYHEGGVAAGAEPAIFLPGEYAHFAPLPDPEATYRGMSWLTPVIRELKADTQATRHKLSFFENAATPNLAVSLAKEITPELFAKFVETMDKQHKGARNAYKTLYTAGGADVTVIGADMKQLDFKVTQGAGETRMAAAAGVHPVVAGLSEGMQGSSLNAGNYAAAKRNFVDTTCRHLWMHAAGAYQPIVPPPPKHRLWYDARDIPFLREDAKDVAEIQRVNATTIRNLVDAGYVPETVIRAVTAEDWTLLKHSGLFSVQLQKPGTGQKGADGGDGSAA
jgi:hypothetical protein